MINKVILVGHLGKDPEVKYLDKDRAVANFSIATNERYNDRNGNKVETTEWHNIEMWDGLAKVAEKYLKKGSLIYVEGKLKTDEYEKDGIKRYNTRIRVNTLNMLDKASGNSDDISTPTPANSAPAPVKKVEEHNEAAIKNIIQDGDDDLPF
ncbi:MAG: single-strand DNA-binding protein [Bacteroidia bacterium]|jgi:single-strand DNA-binding protein|tara:strand:- start:2430 stop:2885 length:456 start_codon:yes stop_codon:yes gene_type:complete